ncbi:hypothetical protein FHR83_009024 [Actinoplanes campanulatus]|uniref:Uncharacterized protein n=1 Tax=Actinoplanes campanulatus TaxID=113559 RepID=A0A7W5ARW6_9ACTN|nr:hypothetical protein [Actinoplanes campanulatus]MBB3101296.1 hypothetical protein [Actinoplanes campanulatus]GGN48667.1 hypothetical protein GCM10010109_86000 [Actinoplanes campanulatus]GID41684.1 hypothetical protein Aca09nite_81900 [Actinoplanes campanulatus]
MTREIAESTDKRITKSPKSGKPANAAGGKRARRSKPTDDRPAGGKPAKRDRNPGADA